MAAHFRAAPSDVRPVLILIDAGPERAAPWGIDPRRTCEAVSLELADRRIEALVSGASTNPVFFGRCELGVLRLRGHDAFPALGGALGGRGFVPLWEVAESVSAWRPRGAAFPDPPAPGCSESMVAPHWVERSGGAYFRHPAVDPVNLLRAWMELRPGASRPMIVAIGAFAFKSFSTMRHRFAELGALVACISVSARDIGPVANRPVSEPATAWPDFAWLSLASEVATIFRRDGGDDAGVTSHPLLSLNDDLRGLEDLCLRPDPAETGRWNGQDLRW